MPPTIHDTGFTIVSPSLNEGDVHLADIVIIHGLQGHPRKTWLYETKAVPSDASAKPRKRGILKALGFKKKAGPGKVVTGEENNNAEASHGGRATSQYTSEVFWPSDLLPQQCPKARIMVYGYETRVVQGYGQAVNQNSVFSHGQDLLYKLRREREGKKPIIFVAHSLGGIILKEMLIHANNTREPDFLEILNATAAVVFLSTPHQGSDHAQLGEIARRVTSAFGLDTNEALLDSLGLHNDDLRRSQQLFGNIWAEGRFLLKTFQESKALVGFNVGRLNELIVPHKSSLLGLPGEDPETLNADHISMCKFKGHDDPNFRSFGDEMKRLYRRVIQLDDTRELQKVSRVHAQDNMHVYSPSFPTSTAVQETLMSLVFGNMGLRKRMIERPSPGTCDWPLTHQLYRKWITRTDDDKHHGLLWLTGHPGSGKSVLIKHLASICASQAKCSRDNVATYFFDARGTSDLEKSMEGLLRDILYQLLPLCETTLKDMCAVHTFKNRSRKLSDRDLDWRPEELQDILLKLCSKPRTTPLFVFVDAVDECDASDHSNYTDPRSVILFLDKLATTAFSSHCNLNICISSRRHLVVSTVHCVKIIIDQVGHRDIERFVLSTTSRWQLDSSRKAAISTEITTRAAGIFLWAGLALRLIAQAVDDGLQAELTAILRQLPCQLEAFFDEILRKLSGEHKMKSSRLFQWILLAQRPLALDEWFHVMALVDMPDLRSLKQWEESMYGIEAAEQLAKRVSTMSGGLLEVTTRPIAEESDQNEATVSTTSVNLTIERSVSVFAGSMDSFERGIPAIQFVHESVREYFRYGNGFNQLGKIRSSGDAESGHIYIMAMCLQYAQLEELNWMVDYHSPSEEGPRALRHERFDSHVSVASFGSSAASSARRSSTSRDRAKSSDDYEIPQRPQKGSTSPHEDVGAWLDTVNRLASGRSPSLKSVYFRRPSPVKETPRSDGSAGDATTPNRTASHDSSKLDSSNMSFQAFRYSYPALRLYVIDMFVHHAVAAAAEGADISPLLDSIERDRATHALQSGWSRWCRLNEDTRSDTTPAYFAAEYNLCSWLDWYTDARTVLLHQAGGKLRFPLVTAAARGHDSVVSRLLPHVASRAQSLDQGDEHGWTVMHGLAALKGGEAVLLRLCNMLEAGELRELLWSYCPNVRRTPLDCLYERATTSLGQRISRISPKRPGDSHSPLDRFIRMTGRVSEGKRLHLDRGDRMLLKDLPLSMSTAEWVEARSQMQLKFPRPTFCLHVLNLVPSKLEALLSDVREIIPALGLWTKLISDLQSESPDADGKKYDPNPDTIKCFLNAVEYSQSKFGALY